MTNLKKPRVLIVDDCDDTRMVFALLLENLGAEVMSAQDGSAGADAVKAALQEGRPFILVVLDMRMPNVNGVDSAKMMRESGFKGLIAACTASSSVEGRKESIGSGVDHYFSKAVVNKKLFSALLDQARTYPQK